MAAWRRDHDGVRYGGFYTQDEARHVVAYAAARGITVEALRDYSENVDRHIEAVAGDTAKAALDAGLIDQLLLKKCGPPEKASAAEVDAFYSAHPQNFQVGEQVRASHILIKGLVDEGSENGLTLTTLIDVFTSRMLRST